LIERADLLSNVETRLIRQIKNELKNKPETRDQVLGEIQRLPANQRKAVQNLEKSVQSLLEFDTQHGTLNRR